MAKFTSSPFVAAHVILLVVTRVNWILAAPAAVSGNDGLLQQPLPGPFGHMGVTTVCVELRPSPHVGPQQICGPIVPQDQPPQPIQQQDSTSSSSRSAASPSELDFLQSQQMQHIQQQQMFTPVPEFMMRSNEPQHQQQQHQPQALMEQPCMEPQPLYDQRLLNMVPPPQFFTSQPPSPPAFMAKAADGRTFFLAPWGIETPAPAPEPQQHEQRAAYDCDSLKTGGIRGFPPRVYNSRNLPMGPSGFVLPPLRQQIPFQTPQHMRAAPSMNELMKASDDKDKIIAAKSNEIAQLQREINNFSSQQKTMSTSSNNVSSVKVSQSSQKSQSTEKSDGVRAVVSSGDQLAAASSSSAVDSLASAASSSSADESLNLSGGGGRAVAEGEKPSSLVRRQTHGDRIKK